MKNQNAAMRIVCTARSWLGTPYQHQASLQHIGCDCLGLVRGIWREVEGSEPEQVPAYSSAWSEVSAREQLLDAGERHFVPVVIADRQIGDLLIFRIRHHSAAKHLGILSKPQKFIHSYDGTGVVESFLSDFWSNRIASVFRFPSANIESVL